VAMPSQVAERMNRLFKVMPLIVVDSNNGYAVIVIS
jgi:hypothetical protein